MTAFWRSIASMVGAMSGFHWIAILLKRISIGALLVAMAIPTAPPATAQTDQPISASEALEAGLARRDRAFASYGIAPPIHPPLHDTSGMTSAAIRQATDLLPKIAISDVRLGLMQMALAVGPEGQAEIYAALPSANAPALYLREGRATLADLVILAAEAGHPNALRSEAGTYTASVPIIVLAGAALAVVDRETLVFSGEHGGFLLSFGSLSIVGATITADISQHAIGPDAFRPFVASLGSGGLSVRDSRFNGLGFGPSPALSGLSVATAGLYGAHTPSVISRSIFTDLGGVSVVDSDSVMIEGNWVADARQTAIRVEGSQGASLLHNVVTGTQGSHAVRLSGPGRMVEVRENILSGGDYGGLRLDTGVAGVEVSGNLIEDFRGEGVAVVQGARCVWLQSNVILENGGNAVRAEATGDLVVTGNLLLANGGAGLALREGIEGSSTLIVGNVIADNTAGLYSATEGHLRLSGNDLSQQLPRLLTGDLAQHTPLLLRAMRAGSMADLDIRHVTASLSVTPAAADASVRAFAACQGGEAG
ncbi:right-handed parallel beta-helix repeat-containing protein [Roseicyclus marinus]